MEWWCIHLTYWPNIGAFGPSVPQPPNLTFLRKLQYTSARTHVAHATLQRMQPNIVGTQLFCRQQQCTHFVVVHAFFSSVRILQQRTHFVVVHAFCSSARIVQLRTQARGKRKYILPLHNGMVEHALTYWPNVGPSLPKPPNLTSLWKLLYSRILLQLPQSMYFQT